MRERPILFNGQMVREILGGRKTQTRRVMKPQPVFEKEFWKWASCMWSDGIKKVTPVFGHTMYTHAPYRPGDRLWVRETFRPVLDEDGMFICIDYRADPPEKWERMRDHLGMSKWTPSIHMPRSASRITLEVTDVRAERLHDISEEDVLAEGLWKCDCGCGTWSSHGGLYNRTDAISAYKTLWDGIYGSGAWDCNPWVWVICFKVLEVKK